MAEPDAPFTINDRTAEVFGPLVAGRDCGACNACCTHLDVISDEYSKPAGQPCAHLCETGCGIYETRFPVCRKWFCLWRHIDVLPDEARPDRLGAILTFQQPEMPKDPFRRAYISAVVFDAKRVTQDPLFDEVLAMFAQGDLPVWVGDDAGLVLSYPHPEVARCAMGQPNADIVVQTEAARWSTGVRDEA